MNRFLSTIMNWLRLGGQTRHPSSANKRAGQQTGPKPLPLFAPQGNCSRCGLNRVNNGAWLDSDSPVGSGVCIIRGFDIHEPATTYCKNFDSREHSRAGATYAVLLRHSDVAAPWLDLAVPRVAPAHCCICGAHASVGIVIDLPERVPVECCGPAHYLEWWTDYQWRRLDFFKRLGEKAYSDMYDVVFSGASAHYSDAKEALYSAISVANDLEMSVEARAIEERLAHIKDVYRHQFK
jgi:hypothetical protein